MESPSEYEHFASCPSFKPSRAFLIGLWLAKDATASKRDMYTHQGKVDILQ